MEYEVSPHKNIEEDKNLQKEDDLNENNVNILNIFYFFYLLGNSNWRLFILFFIIKRL